MKHPPIRSYLVSALIMVASSPTALALDINSASTAELEAAGFTRVQAHNIKAYHAAHGNFKSAADLLKVKGITRNTLTAVENKLNATANANANTSVKANAGGNVSAGGSSTAAGSTGNATGNGGVRVGGGGVSVGGNVNVGAGANAGAGGGITGDAIGAGAQGGDGVGIGVK